MSTPAVGNGRTARRQIDVSRVGGIGPTQAVVADSTDHGCAPTQNSHTVDGALPRSAAIGRWPDPIAIATNEAARFPRGSARG
jgi:hypothetical protein